MIRLQLSTTLSCLLLMGLACSDDVLDADGNGVADGILTPNNVSVITPTIPRGYVAGQVVDAVTGQAIHGASVRIFGAGQDVSVKTEKDGRFQHGPIAAGAQFSVQMNKTGYTVAHLTNVTINDAAGNFPVDNGGIWLGPIGLLSIGSNIEVQVVSYAGQAVAGAKVSIETNVGYTDRGSARGSHLASAETNMLGLATISTLANVFAFPPTRRSYSAITINVGPVDLDGDGRYDLRGAVKSVSGPEAFTKQEPYLIVMQTAEEQVNLAIVASNVDRLVPGKNPKNATVLDLDETIIIVFNQAVQGGQGFLVTLTDETGDNTITTAVTLGALGNIVQLSHDTQFASGQEYNLRILARTSAAETGSFYQVSAPFFAKGDPMQVVRAQGSFVDRNGDGLWGNANDVLELRLSAPIGRADAQGFIAEMYVELDLNGTSTVGDARGELPRPGSNRPFPLPILLSSNEPTPPNSAGLSGYTRFLAPFPTGLAIPLTELQGPVAFELRFKPARNAGHYLVDPEGRQVATKIEGTATLVVE